MVLSQHRRAPGGFEGVHRVAERTHYGARMTDGLWTSPPRLPRRRRRRLRRATGWIAAGTIVVAAVVGGILALPSGHRSERVALHPCPLADRLVGRCGRLAVPLDPTRPGGAQIELRVAVLPATHEPAQGALFYLEGGPGGASTASATAVSELLGRVERTRDLVLVDQRGTGGSHAVVCPPPRDAIGGWLRRCLARHPDARYLTTAAAADDLEAVRRSLGYGRIDLFGASYGATLAQVYLRLHPDSVRTAVLDAATPLGVAVYAREAATAGRALRTVLAECAAEPRCARAYPHPGRDLAAALRGSTRLAPAGVAATLEALLRTPDGEAVIPFDLHRAALGDWRPLLQDDVTYVGTGLDPRLRLAMAWTIQCGEPWARLGAGNAAGWFAPAAVRRDRLIRAGCAAVPRGWMPAGSEQPATSRVPVLVLAGSADPQAAPEPARWHSLFPQGRELVVRGGAHGVAGVGCVPAAVARFVATGGRAPLGCDPPVQRPQFETG